MPYKGWRVALSKPQIVLKPATIVYEYLVFNDNGEIFDRIDTVYKGGDEVAIYSKRHGYISLEKEDVYSNYLQNELTTLRIVDDMAKANSAPLDEGGVITPRIAA